MPLFTFEGIMPFCDHTSMKLPKRSTWSTKQVFMKQKLQKIKKAQQFLAPAARISLNKKFLTNIYKKKLILLINIWKKACQWKNSYCSHEGSSSWKLHSAVFVYDKQKVKKEKHVCDVCRYCAINASTMEGHLKCHLKESVPI